MNTAAPSLAKACLPGKAAHRRCQEKKALHFLKVFQILCPTATRSRLPLAPAGWRPSWSATAAMPRPLRRNKQRRHPRRAEGPGNPNRRRNALFRTTCPLPLMRRRHFLHLPRCWSGPCRRQTSIHPSGSALPRLLRLGGNTGMAQPHRRQRSRRQPPPSVIPPLKRLSSLRHRRSLPAVFRPRQCRHPSSQTPPLTNSLSSCTKRSARGRQRSAAQRNGPRP